jgi:hypothetical protein
MKMYGESYIIRESMQPSFFFSSNIKWPQSLQQNKIVILLIKLYESSIITFVFNKVNLAKHFHIFYFPSSLNKFLLLYEALLYFCNFSFILLNIDFIGVSYSFSVLFLNLVFFLEVSFSFMLLFLVLHIFLSTFEAIYEFEYILTNSKALWPFMLPFIAILLSLLTKF